MEGQTLTTAVEVVDVPGGAMLRFVSEGSQGSPQPEASDNSEVDSWDAADAKWAEAEAARRPSRPVAEGALLIVAEEAPGGRRVRVARAEMEGHIVKELSETSVLERLRKDFADLERAQ